MKAPPRPRRLKEINDGGALVSIVEDERQPFGRRTISFNEAGFEQFHGLIDEFSCNGLALSYNGMADGKVSRFFKPDLQTISRPDAILELTIGDAGAFASEFDVAAFRQFANVKALTLYSIPMHKQLEELFPRLEVLRIFDWKANKIEFRPGLWPSLEYLHLVGYRGDISRFEGWNIRTLFLVSSTVEPFCNIKALGNLETLMATHVGGQIDLSALSDLAHLKNVSITKPRKPPTTASFASESIEMLVLEKIDHIELKQFPNLKVYGIDMGRTKRLDNWDLYPETGDPFAAVHFTRYPFAE